jgi:HEAT repeat protein
MLTLSILLFFYCWPAILRLLVLDRLKRGEGVGIKMKINNSMTDLKAINELIAKFQEDDGFVREGSRLKLVGIGKDAIPSLIKALTSKQEQVRWEAAKTLVGIADPTSITALIKALDDEIFDIRWLAAEGLIAIGKDSIEPLLKALIGESKELFLREGAHHIITSIINSSSQKHEFTDILRPVEKALDSSAPRLGTTIAAQAALEKLRQLNKKN